jgi:LexA-binding, inner membrane-associated putative hydrolase
MPSPLGHALAGAAAGWAIVGSPSRSSRGAARRSLWRLGAFFGLLGVAPDIDLLFASHRGPTHSLGAALIAGLAVAAVTRQGRTAVAAAAAYASHTLLDWLSADTSVPVGIMALWPFSREYYQASVHLFESIWRRNETPDFWSHNARAIAQELIILVPATLLAWRASNRHRVHRIDRQPRVKVKQEEERNRR